MNNYQLSVEATTTAINSQGSSMKEQQRFSESLQGRINRLSNAWTDFSLSMGDAVITSSLIELVEGLRDLAKSSADFVDTFGALPPLFGLVGVAVVALSSKFRGFTTSLLFAETSAKRATIAMNGLKVSLRGLAASTIVGAIFVGVGFALEKLINNMAETRKAQEELEQRNNTITNSYTTQREEVDKLIASYTTLSQQRDSGDWNTEQEEEYLKIQQQLGDLMPNLISEIDSKGRVHLKNASDIQKEIEKTERLIELKNNELKANATDKFKEELDARRNITEEIEESQKLLERYRGMNEKYGNGIMDKDIASEELKLFNNQEKLANSTRNLNDLVIQLAGAYSSVEINPALQTQLDELLSSMDASNFNTDELENVAQSIGRYMDDIGKAFQSGDRGLFNNLTESFGNYLDTLGATKTEINNLTPSFDELKSATEQSTNSNNTNTNSAYALAQAYSESEGAIEEQTESTWQNASAVELLHGVTSDQISNMQQAIKVIEILSGVENLNEQQTLMLAQTKAYLAGLYPHLDGNIADHLVALKTEARAYEILQSANATEADTKMANEYLKTQSTIRNTSVRLEAYKREARALSSLINNQYQAGNFTDNHLIRMVNRLETVQGYVGDLGGVLKRAVNKSSSLSDKINTRFPGGGFDYDPPSSRGSSGGSSSRSRDDAQREAEKAAEELRETYEELADDIVDIYKEQYEKQRDIALDAIDDELDALEKAHDKKIDMLDAEMDKYEEAINQRLESINKQEDEDSYKRELAQKQKERQEILNQINVLSMDTSVEGQRRVAELREQLAQQELDIEQFKHDREIELRKGSLEQQLADKQAQIEAEKAEENARYEHKKSILEAEREQINQHYENLLNDERKWTAIRNEVMKGHFSGITSQLSQFATYLKDHMQEIGQSISQNLIDKISEAKRAMGGLKGGAPSSGGSSGGSSSGSSSKNKRYHTIRSGDTYSELAQQYYGDASKWRKIYEANGIDPRKLPIGKKILIPYHEGGIVGQQSSPSKLMQIVNDLFNVRPNEQVIKSLVGELQVPPKNVMQNFIPNMQNLLSTALPSITPNVTTGGNTEVNINVKIDKLMGGKEGADEMFKVINNGLLGKGLKPIL